MNLTDHQIINIWMNKRKNAAQRGIPFDLSFQSVKNMTRAKKCYYTGKPLSTGNRSIDRVDGAKGYTKGNVVACDSEFNKRKGGLTLGDLKILNKKLKLDKE